jgi:membrane protein implicated in regulation of membrane protease activity
MSDLLQQVSSFLNLSKLVAVTVPGMIATLALLLFLYPPACKQDSQSCWYCQGQGNKEGTPKPKAGVPSRLQGTYMVSKLAWEQANQYYKTLSSVANTPLTACSQLPEYIVSSSRLKSDKETVKNLGDLEAIDPGSLLEDFDRCNSALTAAQTELNIKEAAKSDVISTLRGNLTKLNAALADAKAALNSTLERSLAGKVETARNDLEGATRDDSDLKSAVTAVGKLIDQVSDSRKGILSDASTAIPAETPVKTTWQTAAQALGGNVLIFLLVSMLVGQLIDPIQRAIVSQDPIRGLTFPFLNDLYREDQPTGSIRFGDQRYAITRKEDVKPLLEREPNLLEPSYAIGRGLLTQAEYSSLQDKYYTQSQITTGLMLPSALLALVIYIRLLCCGIVKFGWGGVLWCALVTFSLLLLLLAFLVRRSVDAEERKRAEKRKRAEERKSLEEERKRLEQERSRLAREHNLLERKLRGLPLSADERTSLGKERDRLEQKCENVEAQLQRLEEERKRGRPETEYQKSREKRRREANILYGIPSVFAIVVAACFCLNHLFGWGVFRCALVTFALLLFLVVIGVYYFVKVEKPKRLEGERKRLEEESKRPEEESKRLEDESKRALAASVLVGIPSVFAIVVTMLVSASYLWLRNWWLVGLAVGLPTLEVLCFAGGIDRLHNFYSEVQARIVGAAKKQEDSQIKKFADLLSDPNAKTPFVDELKKRRDEIDKVLGPLTGEKS